MLSRFGSSCAVAAVCLLSATSIGRAANSTNHSFTLTNGTVTPVLPDPGANNIAPRTYSRLMNVGAVTSGTAWCSRFDTSPAPNKPGSFPLAPFGNALGMPSVEEFDLTQGTRFLPQAPLYCTADTAGPAYLTGETSP